MKTLIIDNEEDVLASLQVLLKNCCPTVEVVGTAQSAKEALHCLQNSHFDLVFLDIELGDGTGLEVLQQLSQRDFELIFITAHSHYAVQAFRCSATDYLLKPFDPDQLVEAVAKAQQGLSQAARMQQLEVLVENLHTGNVPRRLALRDMENIHLFEIEDLLYAMAEGSYTRLFFKGDKEWLSSKNLKYFEVLLKPAQFFRTHQSYIVNLNAVLRFERLEGGQLILREEKVIPVAVRRQKQLVEALMNLQ